MISAVESGQEAMHEQLSLTIRILSSGVSFPFLSRLIHMPSEAVDAIKITFIKPDRVTISEIDLDPSFVSGHVRDITPWIGHLTTFDRPFHKVGPSAV